MAQFIQNGQTVLRAHNLLALTKQTEPRTSSGHACILICLQDRVEMLLGASPALHTVVSEEMALSGPFLTLNVKALQ